MSKLGVTQRKWLEGLGAFVGGGGAGALKLAASALGVVSATGDTAADHADAPLDEISIYPDVATIAVGAMQQFNATGDFDEDNRDLTAKVTWSSSDASVTIDATGLATAQAVSTGSKVPVTITATHERSQRSAVATVTVPIPATKPPVVVVPKVPELQFITISEVAFGGDAVSPSEKMTLGTTRQLHATGVYDGSTADLTNQVLWMASPESVATVSKTGLVSALAVGPVTIKASEAKGRISGEIDLTVDEDREPPPGPNATLMEITITPSAGFEAYVGEVRAFRATAVYANGKRTDWTHAVDWSMTGSGVEIDKNGKARMTATGNAIISVRVRKPVKALHAHEGVYKGGLVAIQVRVLAAAPKLAVKLPPDGKLNKAVALALVKHLVYLSDPQFMDSAKAAKPGKLAATGDASVDRLLVLTAEVITLWNDLKTLAQARQIWQPVQPRLSALLNDAEGPKVSVPRSELNPALDAVVNITSRVKGGPGSVANSQANTHPQTADILPAVVHVKTPYGELFYMKDQEKDFKRLTDPVVATLPQASKRYAALQARLKAQLGELGLITPFLKSPDAAKQEIHKFASNATIVSAHIADLARELSDTIGDSLKSANRALDAAQRHYVEAENDLKSKKEVDALREEAIKLRTRAEHAFDIVGSAIEGIIGMVERAPSAVFKGAYDVITTLIKEYGDETLNARAIALEQKARDRELGNFADHIRNANLDVTNAMATLGEVTSRLAKVEKNFERARDFAEDGFDDTCKTKGLNCKFHFEYVRAGLVTAKKTYDAALFSWSVWQGLVVLTQMLAEQYAKTRPLQTGAGYDKNMQPTRSYADIKARNQPVLDAMLKDATKFSAASALEMSAAEKMQQQLNQLRITANLAMANVPRRKGGH